MKNIYALPCVTIMNSKKNYFHGVLRKTLGQVCNVIFHTIVFGLNKTYLTEKYQWLEKCFSGKYTIVIYTLGFHDCI